MADSKTYKRGDTAPPAIITCLDDTTPVNLTGATAKFLMGTITADGTSTVKVNAPATITNAAGAIVTYNWAVDDLDTIGSYKAEVEITWGNGTKQTFPADSYLTIIVMADVG